MEGNIRYNIDRAREAQQQHEQKHDVQLEFPVKLWCDRCNFNTLDAREMRQHQLDEHS